MEIFAICVFLILLALWWFFSKEKPPPQEEQDNSNGGNAGLVTNPQVARRKDVQDKMEAMSKWVCLVCAFHNLEANKECVLCHSKRMATVSTNFTSDQNSARKRKEWARQINSDSQLVWMQKKDEGNSSVDEQRYYVTKEVSLGNEGEGTKLVLVNFQQHRNEDVNFDYSLVEQVSQYEFYKKYSWFLMHIASIAMPFAVGHVKMTVSRSRVYEDTFKVLELIERDCMHRIWRIIFHGEEGIDAGGVQRDWYTSVAQQILDPEVGLFISNSKNQYSINPNSSEMSGEGCHLKKFVTFGKFLGRSIFDGQVLPFRFCVPFFKYLLGIPVGFSDLEELDEELYRSLNFIKNQNDENALENLALTFSISCTREKVFDLKENGRNIPVTQTNKLEYIELCWKYYLFDCVAPQLRSVLYGLHQVLPKELLFVFDYKELEFLICGFATIDVEEWKLNTTITGAEIPSNESFCIVSSFWHILSNLNQSDKSKFLQFATGSPRLPVQGFQGLTSYDGRICPFSLKMIQLNETGQKQYIRSHACFNRIDLPIYTDINQLEEAVRVVLTMDSFDFSMA